MGKPEEKTYRNEAQNGCPPIPHRANGKEVVICGVSEGINQKGSSKGPCALRQPAVPLTQSMDQRNVFDPIYQGIIKCPKDSDNFYTKVAISMVALLTLYEECSKPGKDYPGLKRSHSANF